MIATATTPTVGPNMRAWDERHADVVAIRDFLNWCAENNLFIAERRDPYGDGVYARLDLPGETLDAIIHRYVGVDPDALERERRAMLASITPPLGARGMNEELMRLETCVGIPSPNDMELGTLYNVPSIGFGYHICPCGCKGIIGLSFTSERWRLDPATVTVSPSIRNLPCGAHYFIRNGRIEWCEPRPSPPSEPAA